MKSIREYSAIFGFLKEERKLTDTKALAIQKVPEEMWGKVLDDHYVFRPGEKMRRQLHEVLTTLENMKDWLTGNGNLETGYRMAHKKIREAISEILCIESIVNDRKWVKRAGLPEEKKNDNKN